MEGLDEARLERRPEDVHEREPRITDRCGCSVGADAYKRSVDLAATIQYACDLSMADDSCHTSPILNRELDCELFGGTGNGDGRRWFREGAPLLEEAGKEATGLTYCVKPEPAEGSCRQPSAEGFPGQGSR